MIKKIIKWLVILVFIGAGGFAFYRYMLAPLMVKLQGKTVNAGDITRVKKGNIEVIFQASGTVAAKQDEKVTSKPSGLLQAVYVKEGEYVKKGQKLVSVSTDLSGLPDGAKGLKKLKIPATGVPMDQK